MNPQIKLISYSILPSINYYVILITLLFRRICVNNSTIKRFRKVPEEFEKCIFSWLVVSNELYHCAAADFVFPDTLHRSFRALVKYNELI